MFNERQLAIIKYLELKQAAKNSELMGLCGEYSSMTLWRDLQELEAAGIITRRRGITALKAPETEDQSASLTVRMNQNTESKMELAKIATELIRPNWSYYIDAGSTALTLVNNIRRDNYVMITSAINTALELSKRCTQPISIIGGQMNPMTLACSGPQAEHMLDNVNLDIAVLSTSGYSSSSGFTCSFLPESQLKKAVVKKAQHKIMLLDHHKINRNHLFTFASLEDFDVIVTDSLAPVDFIMNVREHGVLLFSPKDGYTSDERAHLISSLFQ